MQLPTKAWIKLTVQQFSLSSYCDLCSEDRTVATVEVHMHNEESF